jgi:hypothetical protein
MMRFRRVVRYGSSAAPSHGGAIVWSPAGTRRTPWAQSTGTAAAFAAVALVLMVAAMWAWSAAPRLAEELSPPATAAAQSAGGSWAWTLPSPDPQSLLWAVRLTAVSAAAAAQALFLSFAAGNWFRRDAVFEVLRLAAGLLAAAAAVAALALVAAGA